MTYRSWTYKEWYYINEAEYMCDRPLEHFAIKFHPGMEKAKLDYVFHKNMSKRDFKIFVNYGFPDRSYLKLNRPLCGKDLRRYRRIEVRRVLKNFLRHPFQYTELLAGYNIDGLHLNPLEKMLCRIRTRS